MAKLSPHEREIAAKAITKAIGYAENGGAPDVKHPSAGKTGEMKSIFQYTPATWKAYAKQYLGDENAPLTPDSETMVTLKKVGDLLDEGYDAKQIASVWNSGDKNAYSGKFSNGSPSIGVNKKYGVKFDVPKYATSVNTYAKQFYGEMSQAQPISVGAQPPSQPNSGLLIASASQPSVGQKP